MTLLNLLSIIIIYRDKKSIANSSFLLLFLLETGYLFGKVLNQLIRIFRREWNKFANILNLEKIDLHCTPFEVNWSNLWCCRKLFSDNFTMLVNILDYRYTISDLQWTIFYSFTLEFTFFGFFRNWWIVFITCQRFIAVAFPLHAKLILTKRVFRIIATALCLISLIVMILDLMFEFGLPLNLTILKDSTNIKRSFYNFYS